MTADAQVARWVAEVKFAYEHAGPEQARRVLDGIGGTWGQYAVDWIYAEFGTEIVDAISAAHGGAA